MSYLDNEKTLQNMVGQGQLLDAFEQFYHNDVVMIEGTGEKFEGKEANRQREQEWVNSIAEMHGGGVTGITADEDAGITMTESWVDVSLKDGNRVKMEEVSVKKWKDDQIIHERFYYNMPN